MNVAHKLASLPVAALVGIVLVSAVLMRNTATVYKFANYGNEHAVPSLRILNELQSHFLEVRVLIWQHIGAHDAALMTDLEQKIASHRQAEDAALNAYEPFVFDAKDRALLAADREAVAAYETLKVQGLDMSRTGQKSLAGDFFLAQKARLSKLGDTLREHIDYGSTLAREASEAAATAERSAIAIGIILALLTVSAMGTLGWLIFRQLTRQFGGEPADVAEVANRVATGDFSSAIQLRPDDTTSLFATVRRMQASLRERAERDREQAAEERTRIEAERAAARENARIRRALDEVAFGIMLADVDSKITYANDFCTNIFRTETAEIRKQLPNFDADRIIGSSFDTFHAHPTHQRELLANLTSSYSAELKLGSATLKVTVNPIRDGGGNRLGTAAQWIDRTLEVRAEEEVNAIVARAIDGDLTARVQEDGLQGFYQALSSGMNHLIETMSGVIKTMAQAATEVRTGADEISRGNLDLSQRTEEQASSLEETAASMEQMTSMVKNNADNAARANQLAAAAREQAERGGNVVGSAIAAMNEINVASTKIANIIGVIDDIAFQTNLLALNAAVEAARAGEQGRGFAVVASEVRNLASRSAAAAKEIKVLIQDSVAKVSDGTRLVDESGQVLGEIVTGVKKVTDVMAEIAASSNEQASGIEQVNKAITSMDGVTQQNAALVEEASAAAQTLTDQAANLQELIARYRLDANAAANPRLPEGLPSAA